MKISFAVSSFHWFYTLNDAKKLETCVSKMLYIYISSCISFVNLLCILFINIFLCSDVSRLINLIFCIEFFTFVRSSDIEIHAIKTRFIFNVRLIGWNIAGNKQWLVCT